MRPAPLLPLALLLLVMLLPVANAFVFGNIIITTFSATAPAVVEQGVKFVISASIGVSGATYPIYVYLVANHTVWGSPIVTNITGVNTYTFVINFPVPPGTYVIYFLIVDSAGYAAKTTNFTPCSTTAGAVALKVVIMIFPNTKALATDSNITSNRSARGRSGAGLTAIPCPSSVAPPQAS